MFHNFFKTAFRNFWKNRGYSFLNITGLAIGMVSAALIFLWVESELNYDSGNLKKDRLYAVRVNEQYSTGTLTHWSTPGVLAPAIQNDIPGIANTCRTSEGNTNMLFTIGDRSMYAAGRYAEPSLFSMFTLPFVQGNSATAFSQLHAIVITESAAKKFFPRDQSDLIGKTVRLDSRHDYVISGVIRDIPANSSMQFEWVAPFRIFYDQSEWTHKWENNSITTYVELKPSADPATVNSRLDNYIQTKVPSSISHLFLFSMNDWHLYDQFENGKMTRGGRIEYVRLFSIIAWIIIVIACINFMNMSTARSEKRAREVGVRKVLGAGKQSLIGQFIAEAILMAVVASLIAVVVIYWVLPFFNILVQKDLALDLLNPRHIMALVLITLVCGLMAGSYPSFYLSSFNPVAVLKGVKAKQGGAASVRKGLVVLQFTVSIVLIISTIIIYQQIQHVRHRRLGFDKNNLMEMSVQEDMKKDFAFIRHDLINTGVVEDAAISDHEIIYGGNNTDRLSWKGKDPAGKFLISFRSVSPEYFKTSGIRLMKGRDFYPSDSLPDARGINVVITASFAKLMGDGSAIGKRIYQQGDTAALATVVGVVQDYVYGNIYGKPDPVVFICMQPEYTASVMYVRLKPQIPTAMALQKVEAVMKKDNPSYPFDYRFVDDQFSGMMQNELLMGKLSRAFAMLAILISCLGLFGLAAYTAERRTKEIGIRKVLGGSIAGISASLSKEFLQLVAIACVIAFPLAWLAMHQWLQGYQYRVEMQWWVFILAGIAAIGISLLTVSFQSVRAAMMNPVKSLRTE
jgi:predicted permease